MDLAVEHVPAVEQPAVRYMTNCSKITALEMTKMYLHFRVEFLNKECQRNVALKQ